MTSFRNVTPATYIVAVDDDGSVGAITQSNVQHCATFGEVDLVSTEHRITKLSNMTGLCLQ